MINTETLDITLTKCPLDSEVICPKLVRDFEVASDVLDLATVGMDQHESDGSIHRVLTLMSRAIEHARKKPCNNCPSTSQVQASPRYS